MARHWAPLKQPDKAETRSRNTVNEGPGSAPSQFGQRPMFSEPGPDQPPPEEGAMPAELRSEELNPTDGRQSAEGVASVEKDRAIVPVSHHVVSLNVSNPPTDADIRAAIATEAFVGDSFVIRDGGGASLLWFVVRGGADTWYYGSLTKAV